MLTREGERAKMEIASLEVLSVGMSRDGRLTPEGKAVARSLARGRDYYTAHTMALLWGEAARLKAAKEDGKEGNR